MIRIAFLYLVVLSSCSTLKVDIPFDSSIIAKYQVLDETLSPKHHKCSENILPFEKMQDYDCSFKLRNLEFDIETKYTFDSIGYLHKEWSYLAEGRLEEPPSTKRIGPVKFTKDYKAVINLKDTFKITKHFKKEKLIFITRSPQLKKDKRRLIFEYK